MLDAALREFTETLRKSFTPFSVTRADMPGVMLTYYQGQVEKHEIRKPPTCCSFNDLETMGMLIRDWIKANPDGNPPAVWHGRRKVVIDFDPTDTWDTAEMAIVYDPRFMAIAHHDRDDMDRSFKFGDAESLNRWLSCVVGLVSVTASWQVSGRNSPSCIEGTDLTTMLLNLKWETTDVDETKKSKNAASVGKSVTAKVSGIAELPDFININVPVHLVPVGNPQVVRFQLMVDSIARNFELRPFPGDAQKAYQQANLELHETIRAQIDAFVEDMKDSISVYHGNPPTAPKV